VIGCLVVIWCDSIKKWRGSYWWRDCDGIYGCLCRKRFSVEMNRLWCMGSPPKLEQSLLFFPLFFPIMMHHEAMPMFMS